MVDDALFAVGTSYAADKYGRKKSLGGRRRTHRRGGVGMVDDALFAVGTSYAADKYGRKAPLGGRRRTVKRGGAGLIDDAIVAGSALTLAHYFAKKRGGKKPLPRRLTKKTLV
jgi:hypothetical protein